MKIVGLIASLFLCLFSIGQKSYYFSNPLPSTDLVTLATDSKWFGSYGSKDVARSYDVMMDGIYIVSTSISSISRETIRESTEYDVRDNYIFGVVENDSVPCVLEKDRYYFGIRNRDQLAGPGSPNKLTRINANEYIVNFYENGQYIPELLTFEKGRLTIQDFNYDFETTVFNGVEDKRTITTEFNELIILTPSNEEYTGIIQKGIFDEGVIFKRKK